jgi:tyrosine-protein phosphatase MSG5
MTLPGVRPPPAPRGFADIPLDEEEEDQEPNFDVPQSQEEKPDSYPNGPIRIYESGIDLYYEPSAEVAAKYDVILNVASEVKNPFLLTTEQAKAAEAAPSSTVGILESPQDTSSPDTPKATPITTETQTSIPLPQPEYIHIPWEHNTDIVPDLHRLVQLIDDRVMQGKRVLVHCQCGVSRSASLIVAYGLYKNPGMTVQEAYDAVKRRSKWIGPNMNLIMQLQEFRSCLTRGVRREHGFPGQMFSIPRNLSTALSSASTTENFELGSASTPATPRTAPLLPDNPSPTRSSTGSIAPFSAGPVEPGHGSFWEPGFRRSWGHSPSKTDFNALSAVSLTDTPYVDTKGHVVPVVTVVPQPPTTSSSSDNAKKEESSQQENVQREKSLKRKTPNFSRQLPLRRDWGAEHPAAGNQAMEPLVSPRSESFHMVGINEARDTDMGDAFGILSPLRVEFPTNPFEQLGMVQTAPERQPVASFGAVAHRTESTKPSSRNDSMEPSMALATPMRNRSLRTKFSSPSLSEQRRLRQLQTDMEASLPHSPGLHKGYMDDLDALMSPRATEFTVNPFHELLSPEPQSHPIPSTSTKTEADPRSPAQHGISPITRNIFDVL